MVGGGNSSATPGRRALIPSRDNSTTDGRREELNVTFHFHAERESQYFIRLVGERKADNINKINYKNILENVLSNYSSAFMY